MRLREPSTCLEPSRREGDTREVAGFRSDCAVARHAVGWRGRARRLGDGTDWARSSHRGSWDNRRFAKGRVIESGYNDTNRLSPAGAGTGLDYFAIFENERLVSWGPGEVRTAGTESRRTRRDTCALSARRTRNETADHGQSYSPYP